MLSFFVLIFCSIIKSGVDSVFKKGILLFPRMKLSFVCLFTRKVSIETKSLNMFFENFYVNERSLLHMLHINNIDR